MERRWRPCRRSRYKHLCVTTDGRVRREMRAIGDAMGNYGWGLHALCLGVPVCTHGGGLRSFEIEQHSLGVLRPALRRSVVSFKGGPRSAVGSDWYLYSWRHINPATQHTHTSFERGRSESRAATNRAVDAEDRTLSSV